MAWYKKVMSKIVGIKVDEMIVKFKGVIMDDKCSETLLDLGVFNCSTLEISQV